MKKQHCDEEHNVVSAYLNVKTVLNTDYMRKVFHRYAHVRVFVNVITAEMTMNSIHIYVVFLLNVSATDIQMIILSLFLNNNKKCIAILKIMPRFNELCNLSYPESLIILNQMNRNQRIN